MKIEVDGYNWVSVTNSNGGSIRAQTVTAVLLFEILKQLKLIARKINSGGG
jgi:hypothetical protein